MRVPCSVSLAVVLSAACAVPGHAQFVSPSAVVAVQGVALPAWRRDTVPDRQRELPKRSINRVNTVLGGALGGVGGTLLGLAIARQTSQGCHDDYCGLGPALLGAALGETIGIAVGAHVGSGATGSEKVVQTTLASLGILIGGAFAGAGLASLHGGFGEIMLPLTPVLQLAAAVLIESR